MAMNKRVPPTFCFFFLVLLVFFSGEMMDMKIRGVAGKSCSGTESWTGFCDSPQTCTNKCLQAHGVKARKAFCDQSGTAYPYKICNCVYVC
ncbi:hypothetical protein BVC80_157g148 [Macleaya cordata]|uniref:Knottin n=1 Tax=Macleaya cordata TaxID=56857 RepID=A0A200RC98_MACCD|nr:hypothetical protein BVC80_157g148 [Macleaya cordata]